MYSDKHICQYN